MCPRCCSLHTHPSFGPSVVPPCPPCARLLPQWGARRPFCYARVLSGISADCVGSRLGPASCVSVMWGHREHQPHGGGGHMSDRHDGRTVTYHFCPSVHLRASRHGGSVPLTFEQCAGWGTDPVHSVCVQHSPLLTRSRTNSTCLCVVCMFCFLTVKQTRNGVVSHVHEYRRQFVCKCALQPTPGAVHGPTYRASRSCLLPPARHCPGTPAASESACREGCCVPPSAGVGAPDPCRRGEALSGATGMVDSPAATTGHHDPVCVRSIIPLCEKWGFRGACRLWGARKVPGRNVQSQQAVGMTGGPGRRPQGLGLGLESPLDAHDPRSGSGPRPLDRHGDACAHTRLC